jgi:uncharacterized protein with NRDE domain
LSRATGQAPPGGVQLSRRGCQDGAVCTVILLRRPGHDWPLLLAANRDERLDRAWDAPAAHWPDRPGVVGGRDRTGGTWMAMRSGLGAAFATERRRAGYRRSP